VYFVFLFVIARCPTPLSLFNRAVFAIGTMILFENYMFVNHKSGVGCRGNPEYCHCCGDTKQITQYSRCNKTLDRFVVPPREDEHISYVRRVAASIL